MCAGVFNQALWLLRHLHLDRWEGNIGTETALQVDCICEVAQLALPSYTSVSKDETWAEGRIEARVCTFVFMLKQARIGSRQKHDPAQLAAIPVSTLIRFYLIITQRSSWNVLNLHCCWILLKELVDSGASVCAFGALRLLEFGANHVASHHRSCHPHEPLDVSSFNRIGAPDGRNQTADHFTSSATSTADSKQPDRLLLFFLFLILNKALCVNIKIS